MTADLIAEIEQAEEGSRELSDRVLFACGFSTQNRKITEIYSDPYAVSLVSPTGNIIGWFDESRPDPSRNVHDALAHVVPEGWDEHGTLSWPGRNDGVLINKARATLRHVLSSGGEPRITAFAATLALALCAASLRAHEKNAALRARSG